MRRHELIVLFKESPDGVQLQCHTGYYDGLLKHIKVIRLDAEYFIVTYYDKVTNMHSTTDMLYNSLYHYTPVAKEKFQVGDKVRIKDGDTIIETKLYQSHGNDGFFVSLLGTLGITRSYQMELIERPKKKEKRYNLLLKNRKTGSFRLSDVKYTDVNGKFDCEDVVKIVEETEEEFEVE